MYLNLIEITRFPSSNSCKSLPCLKVLAHDAWDADCSTVLAPNSGSVIGAIGGAGLGSAVGSLAGGAGGLIAGGVGVNKAMKKSQAQKLAALKASGASAEEIAKTEKTQKRNRVLGTIGGVLGGGYAGSRIGSVGGALVGGGVGAAGGAIAGKKIK